MKNNTDPLAYELKRIFPKREKTKTKRVLWIMPHTPLKAESMELKKILGEDINTVGPALNVDELFHLIHTPGILQKMKEDFQLKAIVSFTFLEPLDIPIFIPIYQFLHICQERPCSKYDSQRDWIDSTYRHYRFVRFVKLKPIVGIGLEEA